MKIFALVITSKLFWNFGFGIIAPSGISNNLIKSGGFFKSSLTLKLNQVISTGVEGSLTSFVLSGTGTSSLKVFTISPFFGITPIPSFEGLKFMPNILLSRFNLENLVNRYPFFGLGYGLCTEIKIISRPIKSSVFLEYNSYPSKYSSFSWFNIGIRLGM
jgi:hypothetical protein